jgi:hypothetical protein
LKRTYEAKFFCAHVACIFTVFVIKIEKEKEKEKEEDQVKATV